MHYRTRIITSLQEIGQSAWDTLLHTQPGHTPFLQYAFLHALHDSGSACSATGWEPNYLTLWHNDRLEAAMPLYLKHHSYGEYVFDWAWADAYERHNLPYYPKLLSAIPFTPVTGPRLLASTPDARAALITALGELQSTTEHLSSSHILFPGEQEATQLQEQGFLLRSGIQFHWQNDHYDRFDDFLSTLDRKKRRNILAERRKVREAGVHFQLRQGNNIREEDWMFFYRCYCQTYAEHRSTPYLNLDFFLRIAKDMPDNLLLTIAIKDNTPIAASLVIHDETTLYGRYWGAIAHVDCLHFEAAYYQPLEFCIEQKLTTFEGGAQGEHKMARGFLPQKTWSAHWLSHPSFYEAVERFLEREATGIDHYLGELNDRNPFKTAKQIVTA
jgi:predicted N-acyltransferase